MKKIISFAVAAIMLISMAFSAIAYDASDAYSDFKKEYPDFVNSLLNGGIDEQLLIDFLQSVQNYMIELNANEKITESNFEKNALNAVNIVSSREKYTVIQDTLIILYPDAVKQIVTQSTVPDEFKPLMNTIKSIFFKHNMLNNNTGGSGSGGNSGGNGNSSDNDKTPDNGTPGTEPIVPKPTRFTDVPRTHGEFAKIIVTAADAYDYAAVSEFKDVPSDAWYYSYVSSAYKAGLITGYPDGSFAPEAPISRADICTIVYRFLKSDESSDGAAFDDDASIPGYAKAAVYSLTDLGIISGMGGNMFAPLSNATRAQTAKIIYKSFIKD